MSIEKMNLNVLKHEQSPFTTISKVFLQSITNVDALGIYCYMASKPNNWIINKKELQLHFNCELKKIDSSLLYLKEIGVINEI